MQPLQQARATLRVGHVYIDGATRSIRFLNPTAEQLHKEGVPILAADLVTGSLRSPNGHAAAASELPLYVAWRERRAAEAQFLLARPGGADWHVSWHASPLLDADGQMAGVLGTVSCGPHQPDPNRLAELSHDLRTPLQALRLQCAVVEQLARARGDLTDALAILRSASERAVRLAMELLECCRGPTSRSRGPAAQWFAVAPFLKGLADEQAVAAQAKGLELRAELDEAEGWEMHSDPLRLGRLLANLLGNGVRYTPRGSILLRAEWRDEGGARVLEVSVIDTGPGIAEEEHESIFHRYERGKAGQEMDSDGSGLGLAVVDRMVEELGLSVEVDSVWGRGSTFSVLVPASLLRRVPK